MHMVHRIGRHHLLTALGLVLAACANTEFVPADGGDGTGTCTEGQKRCLGQSHQACQNGRFVEQQQCAATKICLESLGCVDCDPTLSKTCVGNDVYGCNASGQIGGLVEKCGAVQCNMGVCGSQSCSLGTGLIYLVDDTNRFLSFNPENGANTLKVIGTLTCSASASWPAWPSPTATPFSMSVDRTGKAWVLYTSGQIFWVDIQNADCKTSSFAKGQSGYELFGMGFVSDAKGSSQEKLFIHGGTVSKLEQGDLGYINPATLAISTIGPLAITGTEHSPELTGTGNGELFGFFPNGMDSMVRRLDKTDGKFLQSWKVSIPTGFVGDVVAWAFAHWGGKFYIFVTV